MINWWFDILEVKKETIINILRAKLLNIAISNKKTLKESNNNYLNFNVEKLNKLYLELKSLNYDLIYFNHRFDGHNLIFIQENGVVEIITHPDIKFSGTIICISDTLFEKTFELLERFK